MSPLAMDQPIKTRVLIVDDDLSILEMYSERLSLAGFEVITAATGEDGMARAVDSAPAVILLDIRLPRTNGLDILDILKNTDATKDIPILLLTAMSGPEVRERAIARGADDFLLKSETMPGEVVRKIERAIAQQKQKLVHDANANIATDQP
ncbi:response regulator [Candidatus Berkelbacteria bacterium]|nr:response regulator [Candidatus Berkelbacteria bacterium]